MNEKSPMKQGYLKDPNWHKRNDDKPPKPNIDTPDYPKDRKPKPRPRPPKPNVHIPDYPKDKRVNPWEGKKFPRGVKEDSIEKGKGKGKSPMKQAGFIGSKSDSQRNFSENQRRYENIKKHGDRTSDYNKAWAKAWEKNPGKNQYDHSAGQESNQQYINKSTKAWAEAKTEKLGRKLTKEEFDSGKRAISQGRKAY